MTYVLIIRVASDLCVCIAEGGERLMNTVVAVTQQIIIVPMIDSYDGVYVVLQGMQPEYHISFGPSLFEILLSCNRLPGN